MDKNELRKMLERYRTMRSRTLSSMLSSYQDWKHPYWLFDNAKDRNNGKDRYHSARNHYHNINNKIQELERRVNENHN